MCPYSGGLAFTEKFCRPLHLGSTARNDVPSTIRSANNTANHKLLYRKQHLENVDK